MRIVYTKEGRKWRDLCADAERRKLKPENQRWYPAFKKWMCGPEAEYIERQKTVKRLWYEFPELRNFVLSMSRQVDINERNIVRLHRRLAKLEGRK